MNGLNLSNIQDAKLGGTQVSAIYFGSNKIWEYAHDYSQDYLTIESLKDNNRIFWKLTNNMVGRVIQWSSDKTNWTSITTTGSTLITTLNTGDKIYIKGNNSEYASSSGYCSFGSDATFNVYGNIMSLITANFTTSTTLSSDYALAYLFYSSKVVDISNLIMPATTLSSYCYHQMFRGCSSLTTLPVLPATTLAPDCYERMFQSCTSLTSIPNGFLPATTLATYCYRSMFDSCSGITTVPTNLLPATTLAANCYRSLFYNCLSLTTAPDLPAAVLPDNCYQYLFYGCSHINSIKCYARSIGTNSLSNWVKSVDASGTFYYDHKNVITSNGISGIPNGWDKVDIHDYINEYLTIDTMVNNNVIGWKSNDSTTKTIQWSTDLTNWTSVTSSTSGETLTTLNIGDKLYIKGTNNAYGAQWSTWSYFTSTRTFDVYGNIKSLIYGDNFVTDNLPNNSAMFWRMFLDTKVVNAASLILPSQVRNTMYVLMFGNCVYLNAAPSIPNASAYQSYNSMFYNCHFLTTGPVIYANPGQQSYANMFDGCTSLRSVTVYATDLGYNGFENWMNNVASTGTFTKKAEMTMFPEGKDGIPSGWTVVNV